MNRLSGLLLQAFAWLLYLLSAVTCISYLYTFTIRDTVSAIENAFGTLVIMVAMLVLARFAKAAGKARLEAEKAADTETQNRP